VIEEFVGRHLARGDLRALVAELAGRERLWRHLVDHDAHARRYEQLFRDRHLTVWLNCWMDDQETGFHDHDLSEGAVAVVEGRLREERLVLGGPTRSALYRPGEVFDFGAADIHRVLHGGGGPTVSLHAYSPPLWRMGSYEVAPGGALRRHSLSYAEELRPLV
jgi:predicted metal-dependent enzyme (double-stranded beta helix superfamily)